MNLRTQLQLVDNTSVVGTLDVDSDTIVPLNLAISDIRDIQKRTGSFSKTIVLPGTKNNNRLLGHYYDVNVLAGSFDVNKVQKCILIQDGIQLLQNTYLQLLSVQKENATDYGDDQVTYNVVIKDTVGDFFSKINGVELTDLDFSKWDHSLTAENIVGSFGHTAGQGYKYIVPWSDSPDFTLNDLKPALWAEDYWNRIHAAAGYQWTWATKADDNVRFSDLLIPFNGDEKRVSEAVTEASKIIAESAIANDYSGATAQITVPGSSIKVLNVLNFVTGLIIDTEILDPDNAYNPTTSSYTNRYYLSSPNAQDFIFEIDYDLIVKNNGVLNVETVYPAEQIITLNTFNLDAQVNQMVTSAQLTSTPVSISGVFAPGETIVNTNTIARTVITATNATIGDRYFFNINCQNTSVNPSGGYLSPPPSGGVTFKEIPASATPPDVELIIRIRSLTLTIQLNAESAVYGTMVRLNDYSLLKIKQSEFIKSIMTMYNLFVEVDPNDDTKLIYRHRDEFYDSGATKDWTYKLARDREQVLQFMPELNTKRIVLSYAAEDDRWNKIYQEEIGETWGQQEIIFGNEYVKGVDRKEILFGPTPGMNTQWDSYCPLIPLAAPKTKPRILIDGGTATCQPITVTNYVGSVTGASYYPAVSHFDKAVNPTFDINFGICDYYFYDPNITTENNLYNNYWRRTLAQLDTGKLFTAYFALTPLDVAQLKLNDKIRIDNSWWNINKVIDYDAGRGKLTKVELMSVDEALRLLTTNNPSTVLPESVLPVTFTPIKPTNVRHSSQIVRQSTGVEHNQRTSTNNSNESLLQLGKYNVIDAGIRGMVIGDGNHVTASGIWLSDNIYIDLNGNVIQANGFYIEPGKDIVRPFSAGSDPVWIDPGEDTVLPFGGVPGPTWIDPKKF
jgi:hypothetical protein